jgi:F-type H+-transporting ATPase subunit a
MLPLNIVGKFASIISMAFRLFGNIFGGSTIATIYFSILHGSTFLQTLGLFTGVNLIVLLFFGLFEGAIQAFVFAMLTITYLSIAISSEQTEKPIGKS